MGGELVRRPNPLFRFVRMSSHTFVRNATQDWLMEKQITKDYYKDYFATTEQMYIKPREIEILERMGSPFSAYKPELLNDSVL